MKRFFCVIFLVLSSQVLESAEPENKGTIIILRGTSSTGKSSICKTLADKYNWKYISEDDYSWDCQISYWETLFPTECACIMDAIAHENIYHAINRHLIVFKPDITEETKTKALHAMSLVREYLNNHSEAVLQDYTERFQTIFLNDINTFRMQGYTIVVESWGMIDSFIHKLRKKFTIYPILVYVPIHVVFDRTILRNAHCIASGNLREHRLYNHTLRGLLRRFSIGGATEKAIGVIKQEDLNAFDRVEQYLSSLALPYEEHLSFSRRDLTLSEFQKMKQAILGQLKENETAYVTPKFDYELLIHGDSKTPEEYAAEIVAFIESKEVCEVSDYLNTHVNQEDSILPESNPLI